MIARRRPKNFGGIIVFYMDFYDMFVRFGGVFNAILKDLCSKMRYKIPKFFPPAAGQSRLLNEIRKEHAKPPLIVSRSKQLGGFFLLRGGGLHVIVLMGCIY